MGTIDTIRSVWQPRTKKKKKNTFRTPMGNFYYTVISFGLKNAGATYQHTMTTIFHDMMHQWMEEHVDDIVVKSKSRKDTSRSSNDSLSDARCTSFG